MVSSGISGLFRSPASSLKRTISSLFKEPDLDLLISRFTAASSHLRFRHNHTIFQVTVRRLAAAGRLDGVAAILDAQMLHPSDMVHEGFATRLISLYGSARMTHHALDTFRRLPSLGSPRTVMSLNALLCAFAHAGEADQLLDLLRSVPYEFPDIVPNVTTYNTAAHALCKRGDVDGAVGLLRSMEEKRVEPDVVTFNTLLNGLYRSGRFEEAEGMWEEMNDKGCVPDVFSYNARMRGLVARGEVGEAVGAFEDMKRRGVEPDGYSYTALVVGYCKEGKLAEARKMFDEMSERKLEPNRGTFEALVPRLKEAGEMEDAVEMCKESMKRRCCVTVEVLQGVVDGLVEVGKVEKARELVKAAEGTRYYQGKDVKLDVPSK